MIRPVSEVGSVTLGPAVERGLGSGVASEYSAAARSAEGALDSQASEAPDRDRLNHKEADEVERAESRDDPGLAAGLLLTVLVAAPRSTPSVLTRGGAGAGDASRAGPQTGQRPVLLPPPAAGSPSGLGATGPELPAATSPTVGEAARDVALQYGAGDPVAVRSQARERSPDPRYRSMPAEESGVAAASSTRAELPASVSALRNAAKNEHAAAPGPGGAPPRPATAVASASEVAPSTAAPTTAPKAVDTVPAEVARSVDLSALGSTLARALRRLGTAPDEEGAEPKRNSLAVDRAALTAALAGGAGLAAAPGSAPLTSVAVPAPEVLTRSASVADALANLHIDDPGVAVIRVERTALGAIEAHVARHGADISIRLRAVEPEHQARLIHALPAVRRELDASELFVGRVDVRGDVPTDAFGRGASNHSASREDSAEGGRAGIADPEPALATSKAISHPARAAHPTQPGERRRLLVIA
jgi:hypothetical protein